MDNQAAKYLLADESCKIIQDKDYICIRRRCDNYCKTYYYHEHFGRTILSGSLENRVLGK